MNNNTNHILDKDALIDAVKQGQKLKYTFFWRHHPSADGQLSNNCFSQWWESSFVIDDITYSTAEHYMMAEKARLFNDADTFEKISRASSPGAAKKYGRLVQGFDEQIWQAHRFDIVVRGNVAKFGQNKALKTFLLNSKKRILVEASPHDSIWGIGLTEDHPHASNPEKWQGLNLLGFALMAARNQLEGKL